MLNGIDVSGIGQGATFNWDAYRGRIAFAFAKATEGLTFHDPDFARNWADIKAEGITRGAYHFHHPEDDGARQAAFFLSAVNPGPGDLLALDHETYRDPAGNQLPAALVAHTAAAAADVIRAETGAWPWLYTTQWMAQHGYCSGLSQCPLWLANPSQVRVPMPIGPWSLVSAEQTGQRGVDVDVFYGDTAQLARLAVVHAVQPPAPPPAEQYSWRLDWPSPSVVPGIMRQTSTDGGRTWH